MTRSDKNARTKIPRIEAQARLRKAKAFRYSAHVVMAALEERALDRSPVLSNAVLSAIAYADAITIHADEKVNGNDHSTLSPLLRSVLGRDLPDARLRDLQHLLSNKTEMQYGVKTTMHEKAQEALQRLETFGDWATSWLSSRGVV